MNLAPLISIIFVIYATGCSMPQQHSNSSESEQILTDKQLISKDDAGKNIATKHKEMDSEKQTAVLAPLAEAIQQEEKTKAIAKHRELNKIKVQKAKKIRQKRMFSHQNPQAQSFANIRPSSEPANRENYQHFEINAIKQVKKDPLSTFSIDVDTASYSNVRRLINQGTIPPTDAVRVEEFINYFSYDYPAPEEKSNPFSLISEVGPSPWSEDRYLLHIGLQGYRVPESERPPVNLVFLIDVSGSMQSSKKLPLLKKSLSFMTNKLRAEDHVAIVVYAGASGLVLPPTSGSEKAKIFNALDQLQAGGSTNGAAGIHLAYQTALQKFNESHSNLILLATDGDFNVGTTNFHQLLDLIKEKRKTGVAISTLGFGASNYNDHLAEQIADAGNGTASYIDSLQEARKIMVEQIGTALTPIARDTKVQIEFNPDLVSEYRLIGYENRHLENHEFNMDSVDAGDIFSEHSVTAIYEIALVGRSKSSIDPLRYTKNNDRRSIANKELAFLKLRYKPIGSNKSLLITQPILNESVKTHFHQTSLQFQFSASVAAYAQLLGNSPYIFNLTMHDVTRLAKSAKGTDDKGERAEFINQVLLTSELRNEGTNISLRD